MVTNATLFVYDGFNCIADYSIQNSTFTIQHSYLWGTDLSGSLQGAGGVGGLFSVSSGGASNFPTYDGNGNVSEYLSSSGSGSVSAHFEYDPFGNAVVNSDAAAKLFPYRFSTKPLDFETGLYYYTYRYYDPATGRWPSRDPIGERGGKNLYGFVENDPTCLLDYLGEIVVTYSYMVVSEVFPGLEGIEMAYSNSDTRGHTSVEASVNCWCSQNCGLQCAVNSSGSILLNARVASPVSSGYLGLDWVKGAYAHELRHIMSWEYKIKTRVVIPLTGAGACKFSTMKECNNRAKSLTEKYTAIIKLLRKGQGNGDDYLDHMGLDLYATIYSPTQGVPWTRPLGIPEWISNVNQGSKPHPNVPNVRVFGSCQ